MPDISRDDITRDDDGTPVSKWGKFIDETGLVWDIGQSVSLDLTDDELKNLVQTAEPWLFKNFMRFALKVNRNPDPGCPLEEKFSVAMMASCLIGNNKVIPICVVGSAGSSVEDAMVRLSAWCIETRKEADMAMKWGMVYQHPNAPRLEQPEKGQ